MKPCLDTPRLDAGSIEGFISIGGHHLLLSMSIPLMRVKNDGPHLPSVLDFPAGITLFCHGYFLKPFIKQRI
jgi:hypothetical protein